jgi:non-ribosomal peptide synthetase component F
MHLILRDLAAFYAARTTGRPADLPAVAQYRGFVAAELARVTGPDAGYAMDYWRQKLHGARIFALPTARAIPRVHTRPYSAQYFVLDADVMAATTALARAMRSSTFMVLLAAFNVLAHRITGTTDPVVNSFSNGRNEAEFRDVVGSIMNVLPLRTDVGGCASFRDVVARTRQTCLEAYTREIPIERIERELPELTRPLDDPRMCYFIFGMFQPPQFDDKEFQIADGAYQIRERVVQEAESSEIPEGFAWHMDVLPSGEVTGRVLYNLDEFDEDTVVGWMSAYRRIVSAAAAEPDRAWKTF